MKHLATLIAASALIAGTGTAMAFNDPGGPEQKNVERTVQTVDPATKQVLMDDGMTYVVPDRSALHEMRPGETVIIDSHERPNGMNVITRVEQADIHWIGPPPGFGTPGLG